ncbi:3-hydroxyanthranilic acid dioxygenase [Mycena floridula]|nr:3-hydroxyanthranilic acid dioxygenase [Mycena floridula]
MPLAPPLHFHKWVAENSHLLQPPVNNFCLYRGGDYIVMAVGGPNARKDYHINETEEWFFQQKGAMLLRTVDDGVFRDIIIEEGEMFLLPANTPHNPVRYENTVGIVIERERPEGSLGMRMDELSSQTNMLLDRLRWYCESSVHTEPTVIREEAFHVTDLGTQLKPYIEHWMADEDYRRCKECGGIAEKK